MSSISEKLPVWFWIIAGVALVWNAMGVMAFVMQVTMSPEALAAMPEAERALYETFPVWALLAFAAAVFGGAIGSVLLLLRKALAYPVFVISLAGIIIQMIYNFFIAETMDVYGPGSTIMPIMVLVIGAFLVWFSKSSKQKGWVH